VFNTAISFRRARKVTFQDIPESTAAHGADTEKALEKSDKKRFIQMALARLSEADRVAITLFYLRELSLEEIGNITGMPANTVKVRIHRARLRLAHEMKTILKHEALLL
jgi:RNA polymerase sigma-70 factor (ECF subfamily)